MLAPNIYLKLWKSALKLCFKFFCIFCYQNSACLHFTIFCYFFFCSIVSNYFSLAITTTTHNVSNAFRHVIRVGEWMHKKNHDLRSNKKTSKNILNSTTKCTKQQQKCCSLKQNIEKKITFRLGDKLKFHQCWRQKKYKLKH